VLQRPERGVGQPVSEKERDRRPQCHPRATSYLGGGSPVVVFFVNEPTKDRLTFKDHCVARSACCGAGNGMKWTRLFRPATAGGMTSPIGDRRSMCA